MKIIIEVKETASGEVITMATCSDFKAGTDLEKVYASAINQDLVGMSERIVARIGGRTTMFERGHVQ